MLIYELTGIREYLTPEMFCNIGNSPRGYRKDGNKLTTIYSFDGIQIHYLRKLICPQCDIFKANGLCNFAFSII